MGKMFEKVLEGGEMKYFALRFIVITLFILLAFNSISPYYQSFLEGFVDWIKAIFGIEGTTNIKLSVMPYVPLSALVLATSVTTRVEKLKYVFLIVVLFLAIDIFFSLVQVLLQNSFVKYYHIAVAHDFFALSMPVVVWIIASRGKYFKIF